MADRKYIVVTGGVMSGLGKGVAAASIGRLLKNGNRKIITIKCDGYLNSDPGTMNPGEHGEVYVLDSGREVDMDFGHYERFLDITCKTDWNITMGSIYYDLINSERQGDFLGATVQMHPHVIDFITDRIMQISEDEVSDITLIEMGGCTDDDETQAYVNSINELRYKVGDNNFFHVHMTYIDYLRSVGELKTRLAQRDLKLGRSLNLHPDLLLCRSEKELDEKIKAKLARMGKVRADRIISAHDVENIYEIPLMYEDQGVVERINEVLGTDYLPDMDKWKLFTENIKAPKNTVRIAICGKYTSLKDSYASILEALTHAGAHNDAKVEVEMVETSDSDMMGMLDKRLEGFNGILVPGGFGDRGAEGKISVVRYARENGVPFLGLCYGLQLAVVEYARNVCSISDANTTEIDNATKNPVITYLPGQTDETDKGGTMRLGSQRAKLKAGSVVHSLYSESDEVYERHRHRYEVNPKYHEKLESAGLVISGLSPDGRLAEFIELPKAEHPYFIATQAHPEFTSRLERPNPLFNGFIKAAFDFSRSRDI